MKLKLKILNLKSQKGVTLAELIIVLTALILIIGTTVSIFISVLKNQNRSLKEQELFSQASYAIEYMSRSIKSAATDIDGSCLGQSYIGHNYLLTHFDSINSFYQGIKFVTKDGICQEFFLDLNGSLKEIKDFSDSQNILSDIFEVEYARFVINGDKSLQLSFESDLTQPRITLVLDVKTKGQNQQEKIIQTTVSQKNLNVQ